MLTTLSVLTLLISRPAIEEPSPPVSAVAAVQMAALPRETRRLANEFQWADHWKTRSAIGKQLQEQGEPALHAWLGLLRTSADERVRKDALYFARKDFPAHAELQSYILTEGLTSLDTAIRYESLWHVGDQNWTEARDHLHQVMINTQSPEWERNIAAKSLGQLHDPRALPVLTKAAMGDGYMSRHKGNIGLKALTGKNLEDFGYSYGEGAHVSGGREMILMNPDPAMVAGYHAARHSAYHQYLLWLRENQPELYRRLSGPQF